MTFLARNPLRYFLHISSSPLQCPSAFHFIPFCPGPHIQSPDTLSQYHPIITSLSSLFLVQHIFIPFIPIHALFPTCLPSSSLSFQSLSKPASCSPQFVHCPVSSLLRDPFSPSTAFPSISLSFMKWICQCPIVLQEYTVLQHHVPVKSRFLLQLILLLPPCSLF